MPAKYLMIAEEMKSHILTSENITPRRLPTEEQLCAHYQVSRQTIRQALSLLEKEGMITRRQGSGSYTVPLLQHLQKKRIVLLLTNTADYTYPSFISDVEAILRPQGFTLTVLSTENDPNTERNFLTQFLDEPVNILITEGVCTSLPCPNKDLYEQLHYSGTRLIFLNHTSFRSEDSLSICSDDLSGGRMLGEHLIANHLFHPAAILPDFSENAKLRYSGLQSAYCEHFLEIPSAPVFWYSTKDLQELRLLGKPDFLKRFVQDHLSGHDSVFCYSDEIAYYLIKELQQNGFSIPDDFSIVSFDNSYLSTLSRPSITSLGLPFHEPGTSLGNLITEVLFDKKTGSQLLPWKLYSRSSTASLFD